MSEQIQEPIKTLIKPPTKPKIASMEQFENLRKMFYIAIILITVMIYFYFMGFLRTLLFPISPTLFQIAMGLLSVICLLLIVGCVMTLIKPNISMFYYLSLFGYFVFIVFFLFFVLLFFILFNADSVCAPNSALAALGKSKSGSTKNTILMVFSILSYFIIFFTYLFIQSPYLEKNTKKWMVGIAFTLAIFIFFAGGSDSDDTFTSILTLIHLVLLGYGSYFIYLIYFTPSVI